MVCLCSWTHNWPFSCDLFHITYDGVAIKIMSNKDTYFFIGGFGIIAIILYIITFNETIQLYFPEAPIIFTIIAYFNLLIIFNYKEIKVNLHEMF